MSRPTFDPPYQLMPSLELSFGVSILVTLCLVLPFARADQDLRQWQPMPRDFEPAAQSEDFVTLQRGNAWAYLQSPDDYADVEVSALVTIESPAIQLEFFGSTWSAWPDPKFEDRGFEASLLVRAAQDGSSGYRDRGFQWSKN